MKAKFSQGSVELQLRLTTRCTGQIAILREAYQTDKRVGFVVVPDQFSHVRLLIFIFEGMSELLPSYCWVISVVSSDSTSVKLMKRPFETDPERLARVGLMIGIEAAGARTTASATTHGWVTFYGTDPRFQV